jgi:hypothetical protein
VESHKNIITGSVNTGGGDSINGDNGTIIKIINGLSFLLAEYKEGLNEIHKLILSFKPKTALNLLVNLENRINESNTEKDNKIRSKILFLKALCKRDLENFPKEESSLDFIKAYNLNNEDEQLKTKVCIEYLNIGNKIKAIELANNILDLDNYNLTAWFIKCVTAEDITSFLPTVPEIVFKNENFQHNVIYNVFGKKQGSFSDLKDHGLAISFNFEKYKDVTFENKQAWIIDLDLLVSTIINKATIKYISGKDLYIENDPEIINAIKLLQFFTDSLESSEISGSTKHQKFYLNYLKYLSTNNEVSFNLLKELYNKLEKPHWVYTLFYCQITNHKKEFQISLDTLVEYERLNGDLHSEFYLFKTVVLHLLSRNEEIGALFNNYLHSIDIIDERHLFNIINIFSISQYNTDESDKFTIQLDNVLEKTFIIDDLKLLLKSCIEVKRNGYNYELILSTLNSIKDNHALSNNCKNLIAENLDILGKPLEALNYMDTYINKSFLSESLKLYIYILHSLLKHKEDTPKGKACELIELLKFWRTHSNYIDENLLRLEHDLYAKINDLNNLLEVDKLLYDNFPENMHYLYFYLAVLEKKSDFDKIKEISTSIPTIIQEEKIGIIISGILLRNKNNTKKGFEILYNLASDPYNTEARMNYFGGSFLFEEYFQNYDLVEFGHWVSHNINGKTERIKILKSDGIQKNFLGKKKGDKFTNVNPLTNKKINIEITEIFNDALNLFRSIVDEANNPINELGFQSLQIPSNIEDFPKFLIEQFGNNGTNEKTRTDNLLNDYYNCKIGFLTIVSAVFKSKFIDAYLHLTNSKDSKFITIPNKFTRELDKENKADKFVLDFSSLMLFYHLEKELNFIFTHKFIVSNNLKFHIENEIAILKHSRESNLSVNITSNGVEGHTYPEDFNNKRISFFLLILEWIDINCEIDLVAEKLDVLLKLSKKEDQLESTIMNNLIDSLHLSIRENHRYISSDVSSYLFDTKINNNFLNPEKYLLTYYPEKCNSLFYRFLLKSNYIGIDITFEILRDEFIDHIQNKENYYLSAVENLQFSINNNPNIILTCLQFLKYLYLSTSLTLIDKNSYASEIFKKSFYGMSLDLINFYQFKITYEFNLLVEYKDDVFKEFMSVKKLYIRD